MRETEIEVLLCKT